MIQKITKSLLLVSLLFTGSLAFAGEKVTTTAAKKEIKEIETERYYQIDRKWQVDVEFKDDSEARFYVYEIDSQEELKSEIAKGIKKHYGIELSTDKLLSVLEIEEEKNKSSDDKKDKKTKKSDDKDDDKDDEKDDDDKDDKKISDEDQKELVMALIKVIILMVMSQDDNKVDLSELLKLL